MQCNVNNWSLYAIIRGPDNIIPRIVGEDQDVHIVGLGKGYDLSIISIATSLGHPT
jgi:hypothetical protein